MELINEEEDTRHLFSNLTHRKPVAWNEMQIKRDFGGFDHDQIEALRRKPLLSYWRTYPTKPYDDGNLASMIFDCQDLGYIEVIIDLGKNGIYYVNTEGYDYVRYGFEIPKEWAEVIFL